MNNRKEPNFRNQIPGCVLEPILLHTLDPERTLSGAQSLVVFLHLRCRRLHCHLHQILRVLDRADREMAYLSMGEAHRRITDYLNRFSDAVMTQDGASLKHLLSLSSNSLPSSPSLTPSTSASAFIQEFRNWDTAWALPALYVIAYEIRVLAERADKELALNGKSPEKLKEFATLTKLWEKARNVLEHYTSLASCFTLSLVQFTFAAAS